MEERRAAEDLAQYQEIRRGWGYGDGAFRRELMGQMAGRFGAAHSGEEIQETALEKAERLVGAELKKQGWIQEGMTPRQS